MNSPAVYWNKGVVTVRQGKRVLAQGRATRKGAMAAAKSLVRSNPLRDRRTGKTLRHNPRRCSGCGQPTTGNLCRRCESVIAAIRAKGRALPAIAPRAEFSESRSERQWLERERAEIEGKYARGNPVSELEGKNRIDRESGSLVMYRRFKVQRPGHEPHTVTMEVSHSGTPQAEWCDCPGFRFRRKCPHVNMVYDAGLITIDPEG